MKTAGRNINDFLIGSEQVKLLCLKIRNSNKINIKDEISNQPHNL